MNNIIENIINVSSNHIGDRFLKEMYALSILTPGILNIETPHHIFLYGAPEVGKTDLQSCFMDIVPKEHKDIASDFSARVLLYSNLRPSTIISINDKILNDSMGTILNQICDMQAWKSGKIIAVTIGAERVNLVFPPRCLVWCNANKHITEYNLKEVDPMALVGRFAIFEKTYSDKQKKEIFIKRNLYKELDKNKLEEIKKYINDIYEHPKNINCSENLRDMIWERSIEIGVTSLRSIGRNLSMCQVIALTNNRLEVTKEDIEYIFNLLKTEEKPIKKMENNNIKEISDSIKKLLMTEIIFKTLSVDKKLQFTEKEIQKKLKVSDISSVLECMEETKIIGTELTKVGNDRIVTKQYYLIGVN
jgi:hypothetical protein